MTAAQYRYERQTRGTQIEVAKSLGIERKTIQRRELGHVPITREAELALKSLAFKPNLIQPKSK